MKYILITTNYTIKEDDETNVSYNASTDISGDNIKSAIDIHSEKTAAIERKLLK